LYCPFVSPFPPALKVWHDRLLNSFRLEATHAFWGGLQGWFPEGMEVIHVGEPEPEPQGDLDRNQKNCLKEMVAEKKGCRNSQAI